MTDRPPSDPTIDPCPGRPRPPDAGPADERFHDAVEARFRRVVANDPLIGTWLGLHDLDARLADPSRDAVIQQIGDERAHLGAIEAIDPSELSAAARFERDIELHNVRRELFDLEELGSGSGARSGSTRSAIRSSCCSPATMRRSPSGSTRSPGGWRGSPPTSRRRRPVRRSRRSAAGRSSRSRRRDGLPGLFAEFVAAGTGVLAAPEATRLERAVASAGAAVEAYADWLRGTLADGTRRLAHRPRAPRRAGRPSRVRRARRRPDPRARLAEAGRGEGRPRRRGPRSRPGRRRGRRSWPGSRPTVRPTSPPRSTPTARRCCARGST